MKILITGGTGFVGTQLTSRLIQDGNAVTILTRSLKGAKGSSPGISYLEGDPTNKGPWQEAIKNHDAIINLAGASIFSKWTDEHKKAIRESRVDTTQNMLKVSSTMSKTIPLFSTSAVGYYGTPGRDSLKIPPGKRFSRPHCHEWKSTRQEKKVPGSHTLWHYFSEKGGALNQ
jgi:NAD dependent epimerase/dehydratase family enzyme